MRLYAQMIVVGAACLLAGCAMNHLEVSVQMIEPPATSREEELATLNAAVDTALTALDKTGENSVAALKGEGPGLKGQLGSECRGDATAMAKTVYGYLLRVENEVVCIRDQRQAAFDVARGGVLSSASKDILSQLTVLPPEGELCPSDVAPLVSQLEALLRDPEVRGNGGVGGKLDVLRKRALAVGDVKQSLDLVEQQISEVGSLAGISERGKPEPGFGGFVDQSVYILDRGHPEYRKIIQARPISEPITHVEASAVGTSTIMFVQETPTYWRKQSIDMNAEQLARNVLFITDKALKAALTYLGIPIPADGLDPEDKSGGNDSGDGADGTPGAPADAVEKAALAAGREAGRLHGEDAGRTAGEQAGREAKAEADAETKSEEEDEGDPQTLVEVGAKAGAEAGEKAGGEAGAKYGALAGARAAVGQGGRGSSGTGETHAERGARLGAEAGRDAGKKAGREAGAAAGAAALFGVQPTPGPAIESALLEGTFPTLRRDEISNPPDAVKLVQTTLKLPDDQITGIYDEKTEAAVVEFQREHGLTPDGVVGAATWRLISQAPSPGRTVD